MEKNTAIKIIGEYFKSVSQAYALGNIESSYNAPIITLFNQFGCVARDMSGERSGHSGENIDIKLWHTNDEVGDIEPFAGIEVKKFAVLMTERVHKLKLKQPVMETPSLPTILCGDFIEQKMIIKCILAFS